MKGLVHLKFSQSTAFSWGDKLSNLVSFKTWAKYLERLQNNKETLQKILSSILLELVV